VCDEAYARLASATALDAVVMAVARLEDDPAFNAGTGSVLQADGRARLSASVMDGCRRRFAAVLNIERVRAPVLVARRLLEEDDRVLSGPEAGAFARAQGFEDWDPVTPERRRQWEAKRKDREQGTVGAVALDRDGRLAAATSTGGKWLARPGRVSDSGQPVGNYADDTAAVSCTGLGEHIVEEALAVRLSMDIAGGRSPAQAFSRALRALRRDGRHAAAIGVDRRGRVAWMTTEPALWLVARTADGRATIPA
jgi:L-asparaginase